MRSQWGVGAGRALMALGHAGVRQYEDVVPGVLFPRL